MADEVVKKNLWPLNFRDSYIGIDTCFLTNAVIVLWVLDFVAKQGWWEDKNKRKLDIFRAVPGSINVFMKGKSNPERGWSMW